MSLEALGTTTVEPSRCEMAAFVVGDTAVTWLGNRVEHASTSTCRRVRGRRSLPRPAFAPACSLQPGTGDAAEPVVPEVSASEPAPPASNNITSVAGAVSTPAVEPFPRESRAADDWYDIGETLGAEDVVGNAAAAAAAAASAKAAETGGDAQVLDLMALDGAGRRMLAVGSYASVVDVDIELGGVLDFDDEDNNDLHCGVGFDALVENDELLHNLKTDFGIETATHVQLAAIPRIEDGRDIVIQSHTGTGKTLAFLLPLLDGIDVEESVVQAVIVAPTRELAMQISRECDRLCVDTDVRSLPLIGGANPLRQIEKIKRRLPHIVVGTPGRLAELEDNRELRLRNVSMLVVDEVDQCLQESFVEHLKYILEACPRRVQKILVSATGDVDAVRQFAGKHMHKPVLLRVGGKQRLPSSISHYYAVVPPRMRIELLRKLMYTDPQPTRAICFVDDPRRVDIVVERLYQMKVAAAALRGNAHKMERAEVVTAFRKGRIPLLVTTEVAARGLDVPEVSHVFNLDLPTDGDHYVHRAGRCGRVGQTGTVVSVATSETAFVMGRLEKQLGVTMTRIEPRGGVYSTPLQRTSTKTERRPLVDSEKRIDAEAWRKSQAAKNQHIHAEAKMAKSTTASGEVPATVEAREDGGFTVAEVQKGEIGVRKVWEVKGGVVESKKKKNTDDKRRKKKKRAGSAEHSGGAFAAEGAAARLKKKSKPKKRVRSDPLGNVHDREGARSSNMTTKAAALRWVGNRSPAAGDKHPHNSD